MLNKLVLLTGGNLGDVKKNSALARSMIGDRIGNIFRESSIYRSEAWGFESEYPFYNQVLVCDTLLTPQQVLARIHEIERSFGRPRGIETETGWKNIVRTYQSRVMDIDILFYNDMIVKTDRLTIPHPLIQDRMFVLIPLTEIEGDYIHPVLKKSIKTLKEELSLRSDSEKPL